MPRSPHSQPGIRAVSPWRRVYLLAALVGFVFLGVAIVGPDGGLFPAANIAHDPIAFRELIDSAVAEGSVPLLEARYEHLPLNLIPMAAAWTLGGAAGDVEYWLVFAFLMVLAGYVTAGSLERIGRRIGDPGLPVRWILVSLPLAPLALVRVDLVSVMLAVLVVELWLEGRERPGDYGLVTAVLVKGWAIVLSATAWWQGRRRSALWLVAISIALLGVTLTLPGFRAGRGFTGVHTESMAGGVIGLWRVVSATSLDLASAAGARYLAAPGWVLALQALAGTVLALWAMSAVRQRFNWAGAFAMTGGLIVALLVASPLVSTQFVMWLLPFVAMRRDSISTRVAFGVAALSLVLIAYWPHMVDAALWWWALLNIRNAALIGLGVRLVWLAGSIELPPEDSPTRGAVAAAR